MSESDDRIVLPPLEREWANLWRRMRESLGSSDKVLLKYAVTLLAQLVEAEEPDAEGNKGVVVVFRGEHREKNLKLPVRHGLIVPFTTDPTRANKK